MQGGGKEKITGSGTKKPRQTHTCQGRKILLVGQHPCPRRGRGEGYTLFISLPPLLNLLGPISPTTPHSLQWVWLPPPCHVMAQMMRKHSLNSHSCFGSFPRVFCVFISVLLFVFSLRVLYYTFVVLCQVKSKGKIPRAFKVRDGSHNIKTLLSDSKQGSRG